VSNNRAFGLEAPVPEPKIKNSRKIRITNIEM
jgi:hypothetical protein